MYSMPGIFCLLEYMAVIVEGDTSVPVPISVALVVGEVSDVYGDNLQKVASARTFLCLFSWFLASSLTPSGWKS